MQQRIHLLTLGVSDLEKSMKFYRDGLRWQTKDIVGAEFENGAVSCLNLPGIECFAFRKGKTWHGFTYVHYQP